MKDIESEKVYMRLEPTESIQFKREVLEILINLIQSQIISKRFEEIRKAEVKIMRQLKTNFQSLHKDFDQVLQELPKRAKTKDREWDEKLKGKRQMDIKDIGEKTEKKEGARKEFRISKTTKAGKYQAELEKIKSMLDRLR